MVLLNLNIVYGNQQTNNKCFYEKIMEETIFQGGLHAGNYKDLGKLLTDEQCLVYFNNWTIL